jgi:hypothetical protein
MANPPIEPTPKQPEIEQPAVPEMPKASVEPTKPFDIGAGQVTAGMQMAMKHYLQSGMPKEWKETATGEEITATTGKDSDPPAGAKSAEEVTLTAMRGGQVVGKESFAVVEHSTESMTIYSVYSKPGNQPLTNLDTSEVRRIPDNLGALMREDPALGRKLYHSLIVGMAMNMMRQMRTKAGKLFKPS